MLISTNTSDLRKYSKKKVLVECDKCHKQREITFQTYNNLIDKSNTYCKSCAQQQAAHKRPQNSKGVDRSNRRGEKHHNWKGGKRLTKDGYILNYTGLDDKLNSYGRSNLEHVLVIEQAAGAKIKKGQCVHHLNGNRQDNNLENLVLLDSHKAHKDVHTSLQETAYQLYKAGIIRFNRENNKYEISVSLNRSLNL